MSEPRAEHEFCPNLSGSTPKTSPQPLLLFFCDTTLLESGRVTAMASCGCHVRLLLRIQFSSTRPVIHCSVCGPAPTHSPVQVLNRWSGWIRPAAALWPLAVRAALCRLQSSSAWPCAALQTSQSATRYISHSARPKACVSLRCSQVEYFTAD